MKPDLALQLLTLSALSWSCVALPQQLGAATLRPSASNVQRIVNSRHGRKLTGKFLHITGVYKILCCFHN
jgi:polyisoprenoid-binding protein YceI